MSHPDSHFRDKLYDLETPLGSRMSFEEVMNRRKAGRKMLWWKPVVIVLAGLFTIAGSAYFYMGENNSKTHVQSKVSAVSAQSTTLASQGKNEVSSPSNLNELSQIAGSSSVKKETSDSEQDIVKDLNKTGTETNTTTVKGADFAGNKGQTTNSVNTQLLTAAVNESEVGGLDIENDNLTGFEINDRELKTMLASLKKMGLFRNLDALEAMDWKELEGLSREYNMPKKSLWPDFVEFSMVTGGNGYRNFDEKLRLSVRGNHQFSQYRVVALYSLPGDILLGSGFISEWGMGAAQVRRYEDVEKMVIDSHTVVVIQPGLPPKNVVVKDTSMITELVSKGSEVSYRLSKYAVPLALRYMIHTGKGSIRLGMDIAPGVLASQSGTLFSRNSILSAEQLPKQAFTLDMKLSAGVQVALSSKASVIAEPVLNMQRVRGAEWKQFNRTGLGFGLGFVYRL